LCGLSCATSGCLSQPGPAESSNRLLRAGGRKPPHQGLRAELRVSEKSLFLSHCLLHCEGVVAAVSCASRYSLALFTVSNGTCMNLLPASALKPRKSLSLVLAVLVVCALGPTRAEAQPKVRRGREIVLSTMASVHNQVAGTLSFETLKLPLRARAVRISPDGTLATVSIAKPGSGGLGEPIPLERTRIERFCTKIISLNPRIRMDCEPNLLSRARGTSGLPE
jgi:hypothetical protein